MKNIEETVEKASHWVWLKRNDDIWLNGTWVETNWPADPGRMYLTSVRGAGVRNQASRDGPETSHTSLLMIQEA